ncbi:MAG: protein-arginine deiminase family protein [Roseovarius sp.]
MSQSGALNPARDFFQLLVDRLVATGALDEARAYTFCESVLPVTGWSSNPPSVVSQLVTENLCPFGQNGTALFAAVQITGSTLSTRSGANTRLMVVVTDGEDTVGGAQGSNALTAANAIPSNAIGRLVHIGNSSNANLDAIAANAQSSGKDVQAIAATTSQLNALVNQILDATCANFQPNASFTLSDNTLQLTPSNNSIEFDAASSSDVETAVADLEYDWVIMRPDGSTFTRSTQSFEITFTDSQLPGEGWNVQLTVTDEGGATHIRSQGFFVRGSDPVLNISGGTVDALQNMTLSASPNTDIDGGSVTHTWRVIAAPVTAQYPTGHVFEASQVNFTTVEGDIGDWVLIATATDNEGEQTTATVNLRVNNLPPPINLSGPSEIMVETVLEVETTERDDPDNADGGGLTYSWDIVQSPQTGNPGAQTGYATTPEIAFNTSQFEAGTYIFGLTVTDDEPAPFTEEEYEEITVLVDAPPKVEIVPPGAVDLFSGPVTLDGSDTADPDSPCQNEPDRCHVRTDGAAVEGISGGIVSYSWSLTDLPPDAPDRFVTGRVDEALGLNNGSATLLIPQFALSVGDWTFTLEVEDAEGNTRSDYVTLTVLEPETPPIALPLPLFQRKLTDVSGIADGAVGVNGQWSWDLDNLLLGEDFGPGVGITNFLWEVVSAPAGCTGHTTSAFGPEFALFPAGATIDPLCGGRWLVELIVTDDDQPPEFGVGTAMLEIGNCPQLLCIDYPNTEYPQTFDAQPMDVVVYYHLNSLIYDQPGAVEGVMAELDILPAGTSTPVRTIREPSPLPPQRNSFPTFHWDGLNDAGVPVANGFYDIRIRLQGIAVAGQVTQEFAANAIILAVAQPDIESTSEVWAVRENLGDLTDTLDLDFTVTGGANYDTLAWRVIVADGSADDGNIAHQATQTAAQAGTISWDGQTATGLIKAGVYKVELEARRGGQVLGTSDPHDISILQVDLDADTDRSGTITESDEPGEDLWLDTRGAYFSVNLDADDPSLSNDAVQIDHEGIPRDEDLYINTGDTDDITPLIVHAPGAPLPAGLSLHLVAATREDAQSIHLFPRIAEGVGAILGQLGNRNSSLPASQEADITSWIDGASGDFSNGSGAAPTDERVIGIEGMFFRDPFAPSPRRFDGEIGLTLELRDADEVIASDTVRMKVAPWMMVSHLQPSTEIWAMNGTGEFLTSTSLNAVGLDTSGQLQTADEDAGQWFQDHVEIGATQRPGGPLVHSVLRTAYGEGSSPDEQPVWPIGHLRNGTTGMFQLAQNLDPAGHENSGDFGGNLELQPPSDAFAQGRIVVGDTVSQQMFDFLGAQEVQPVIELPTRWLDVGHVDEMIGMAAAPGEVVIASPSLAWALLEDIPAADQGKSVLFATGELPETGVLTGVSGTRLETGVNHLPDSWNFIRIWADNGSLAQGQVARISALGDGWIEIDRVWDVPLNHVSAIKEDLSLWSVIHGRAGLDHDTDWFVPPAAGDSYVLVEQSRFWYEDDALVDGGFPAIITVAELLEDEDLKTYNTSLVETILNDVKDRLDDGLSTPNTYLEVPVLFLGVMDETRLDLPGRHDPGVTPLDAMGRSAFAFTPGLANMQPINPAGAALKVYYPKPFGPRDASGIDPFETATSTAYGPAYFVDEWDWYHRNFGEVHCGTATRRTPRASWWTDIP